MDVSLSRWINGCVCGVAVVCSHLYSQTILYYFGIKISFLSTSCDLKRRRSLLRIRYVRLVAMRKKNEKKST